MQALMQWVGTTGDWAAGAWPWIAGGGVLAIVGVLAAMNPVLALRVAKAIGAVVLDKSLAALNWIREPGNGYKAMCLALAAVAAYGLLDASRARDRVVVVTRERDDAQTAKALALEGIEAERLTWKEQEQKFADIQRRVTEATRRAQAASEAAQEAAAQATAASNKRNAAWLRVYEGRSDVCRAAEEALDVACKEVGDL
jgi:hypothetical protein